MARAKDPLRRNAIHLLFKEYKNRITKLSRNSKANHYHNFFVQNKANLLKTWKGIKSIINTSTSSNNDINTLIHENRTITDKTEISNTFNSYFINVPKNIEKTIPKSKKEYKDYLKNSNPQSSDHST